MSAVRGQMAALLAPLAPELFEFEDQSHLHAGHAGAREGGHFAIVIVSAAFAGLSRIERQRRVQTLLNPLFHNKTIHALSIKAHTPQEFFHSSHPQQRTDP